MKHPKFSIRFFVGGIAAAALSLTPLFSADDTTVAKGKSSEVKTPAAPAPDEGEAAKNLVENSVVKIFAQVRRPDLLKPWAKQSPQEVSGSGIVIEGRRILTNSHVVHYASQVQIQANQAGDKLSATVEFVAPGIDLAVLKLEDETFFETHPPLARASALPQIKDSVLVYGYPTGGTSLSITKGIVSRIEFTGYNHSTSGLRVQIDAAINPGNSGGPALAGDKVIGLAFSHLANSQNIGYIIPSEEIDLFLKDISDGHYDGKPAIFDEFQTLENPALRNFLKLDKSVSGLVVHEPYSEDAAYPLKKWDVITNIGDAKVDDQGMIKLESGLRLRFAYMVQKIAKDGKLRLTVLRGSKEIAIELPVTSNRARVIAPLFGTYPPYFICGPVVFTIATEDLVGVFSSNDKGVMVAQLLSHTASPLILRRGDKPAFDGEQLVMISAPFFPHKISKGYSNHVMRVVESINGTPVKNLLHLVQLIRDAKDEFIVMNLAGRGGETLVFPRAEMVASTEEILTDNGIRALGSPDVMAVWEAKPVATAKSEAKPESKTSNK